MTGEAIQAVQFQKLFEMRLPEESPKGALPHLLHVLEPEVIGDQGLHSADLVAGEAQPRQDFGSHPGP